MLFSDADPSVLRTPFPPDAPVPPPGRFFDSSSHTNPLSRTLGKRHTNVPLEHPFTDHRISRIVPRLVAILLRSL
jgi:hypothetical protein